MHQKSLFSSSLLLNCNKETELWKVTNERVTSLKSVSDRYMQQNSYQLQTLVYHVVYSAV